MAKKEVVLEPSSLEKGYQPIATSRPLGRPPRGGSGVPATAPSTSQKQTKPAGEK
jgi:hypothetical protein